MRPLRTSLLKVTGIGTLSLLLAIANTSVHSEESDQGDLLATMPEDLTHVGTGVPIDYEPYKLAKFTKDIDRYPAATPPKGSFNHHGELEFLGKNVFGIHWFIEFPNPGGDSRIKWSIRRKTTM